MLTAIGMGASLQNQVRWAWLRLVAVLLGLVLPLALATAITAFLFHHSGQAAGIQEILAENQVMADDDRTPCSESKKISDCSCIASLGCVACTVLPEDEAVTLIPVLAVVSPFLASVRAQMRIYLVDQPPKIVSI